MNKKIFQKNNIWSSLNLLRGNISPEQYDVLLFILTLHHFDLINSDSHLSTLFEDINKKITKRCEDVDSIIFYKDLFRRVFHIYERDLNVIDSVNLQNIITELDLTLNNTHERLAFGNIFDSFLYETSKYAGLKTGFTLIPHSIADLMLALGKLQEGAKVYNPFAGVASFGVKLDVHQHYIGQEVNDRTWALGIMRLLAYGKKINDFYREDLLNNPLFGDSTYDAIFSFPPINYKLNSDFFYSKSIKYADEYTLELGLESLKSDGVLVILVNNRILNSGSDIIRKKIVDNGNLTTVIHLPESLLDTTRVSLSILVLEKKPVKEILFVDAGKEYIKSQFKNTLTKEAIIKILSVTAEKKEIKDFSLLVSAKTLAKNDYNLVFKQYNLDLNPKDSSKDLVQLNDILRVSSPNKDFTSEYGRIIRDSDLSVDEFHPYVNSEHLQLGKIDRKRNLKITSPTLLLNLRSNNLKPTFIEASPENPIYIPSTISAFELFNNDININYLIYQLCSDMFLAQLDAYSYGTIIPFIDKKTFLKLYIEIPSLPDQQKELFLAAKSQADRSKIKEAKLEGTIELLIKDRVNELQWQLHDIRNSELLSLKNNSLILSKVITNYPEAENIPVDPKTNKTLGTYIRQLVLDIQNLTEKISSIFDESESFGIQENINLIEFIKSFVNEQNFISRSVISIDKDPISKTLVLFNKVDLHRIFTNIFENIKRHAFHNLDEKEQEVKILFSHSNKNVHLTIGNNGNYVAIDKSDYFANGGRQGKRGNSGKGGYIIKKCMERNGGTVDIRVVEPEFAEDLVFMIELTFNNLNN